uniref:RNA polymerase II subunit B1 CTD phosphatase RPAP2 homolog n=1 Tax=Rhizophora mucronata TaxID=61149 RepID=A0A2P2L2T3_RHIMU
MAAGDESSSSVSSVKDAVHRLQLYLLEGIQNEDQLFAAGSLMSRSDYEDVVTERSIANLCGYPLCTNPLPTDRPHKGRYRISLKEHKVYDLHHTYMYCSTQCVVNSRVFAESLRDERCSVSNPSKLNEVLRLFDSLSLDYSSELLGKNGDLGFSNLRIQENTGEQESLEQWFGPSNAIEGYVPRTDRNNKPLLWKNSEKGIQANHTKPTSQKEFIPSDMDFMSTIIMNDEYSISKSPSDPTSSSSDTKVQERKDKVTHKAMKTQSSGPTSQELDKISRKSKGERSKKDLKCEPTCQHAPSSSNVSQSSLTIIASEAEQISQTKKITSESMPKSSIKSSGAKKFGHSVTWVDEKIDSVGSRNLCEVRETDDTEAGNNVLSSTDKGDGGDRMHFESAEACATASSETAEVVSSEQADVIDAISEAGDIILPSPHNLDQMNSTVVGDAHEPETDSLKWPRKPGIPHSDFFDSEDSWYDSPPEGFSLTLSSFATMWMVLFAWVTSSSLAYIYGRDDSFHEDYLLINGREYTRKIVLGDHRSSEIKQSVAGCLARVYPGLVTDLRLPVPISTLEQVVSQLLDTMSFVDALPALRIKQWLVIAFLFLESLSVCRIPALTPHMSGRRVMLHKVLDGAQISVEEYELMRDFLLPLGRAPQFSAQSGA